VIVGPREALLRYQIALQDLNWLGPPLVDGPVDCHVRIRSSRPPVPATLRLAADGPVASIAGGEFGVAPGQACVFYEGPGSGQRVLGGGFIASSLN
jgi:tRNA-specific 2-thiouridylase